MTFTTEEITLTNNREENIAAVLHVPPQQRDEGHCVVLCHGMLSNKDGTKQIALCRALHARGIASLRFDFRGRGRSDGAFEDTTISRRLEDLEAVLAHVDARGYSSISLVGSSLGAPVAIIEAAKGPAPAVASLVTYAAVSRAEQLLDFFPPQHVAEWKKAGMLDFVGNRIKWDFIDDALTHDVLAAAGSLRCPTLLIHGSADALVPVESSRIIWEAIKAEKDFVLIEGADHTFIDDRHREQAIELTLQWIEKHH
ncbi:MAG: alpha/beta hydrolase [Pseudomonadota bacterium]